MAMRAPSTYEPYLWLVQYNLAGLQKPRKVAFDPSLMSYWDKSGNFSYEDDVTDYDIVQRAFLTEQQAKKFYTDLYEYREFIKRHM